MTKDECRNCPYVEVDEIDSEYWTCIAADGRDISEIDECPQYEE